MSLRGVETLLVDDFLPLKRAVKMTKGIASVQRAIASTCRNITNDEKKMGDAPAQFFPVRR